MKGGWRVHKDDADGKRDDGSDDEKKKIKKKIKILFRLSSFPESSPFQWKAYLIIYWSTLHTIISGHQIMTMTMVHGSWSVRCVAFRNPHQSGPSVGVDEWLSNLRYVPLLRRISSFLNCFWNFSIRNVIPMTMMKFWESKRDPKCHWPITWTWPTSSLKRVNTGRITWPPSF